MCKTQYINNRLENKRGVIRKSSRMKKYRKRLKAQYLAYQPAAQQTRQDASARRRSGGWRRAYRKRQLPENKALAPLRAKRRKKRISGMKSAIMAAAMQRRSVYESGNGVMSKAKIFGMW
jgi:hypothetical protein